MALPLPLPTYTTDDLRPFADDGQRFSRISCIPRRFVP
jgi:hypothetical protein